VKEVRVLRIGDLFVDASAIVRLQQLILSLVEGFHRRNPLVGGIAREALREQVKASAEVFAASLDRLSREKKIEAADDLVRLPGHGVVMKDEEAESKKQIEAAFAGAGLKVPALQEVIAGLKVDKARAQKIVTLLLRDKLLVKVSEELVFHRSALEELRRLVAAQKARSPKMDVAQFKELTGVSRKYAIPLLEYLDRERVTKRVGDAREIL
jgi:selenocysteine-specific elongation factor